jgi:predicted nuclease with TOPRIM domain
METGVSEIVNEPTRFTRPGNLASILRNIPEQTGQMRVVHSNNNSNRTTHTYGDTSGTTEEIQEEIEEPTTETMSLLRMTQLRQLEHERQELKNHLDEIREHRYSYPSSTWKSMYDITQDRIDAVNKEVNSLRKSISYYLPSDSNEASSSTN